VLEHHRRAEEGSNTGEVVHHRESRFACRR
jgi:hypothetical protein